MKITILPREIKMKRKDKLPYKLPPFNVESLSVACSETIDWGLTAFNIPEAWRTTSGKNIKVAVLDTGASLNHPDLIGQIFTAKDFTGSSSGPHDNNGHGTHCAGIAAGATYGWAKNAKIYSQKLSGLEGSGDSGTGISTTYAFDAIKIWHRDKAASLQ